MPSATPTALDPSGLATKTRHHPMGGSFQSTQQLSKASRSGGSWAAAVWTPADRARPHKTPASFPMAR